MAEPEWMIVGSVDLLAHHWPSKTGHTINGVQCEPFTRLEIATFGQMGFYLLHVCADGRGTDTFHETLADALDQAKFEFGVERAEWHMRSEMETPHEGG
jgi:hypothetical protein